MHAWWSRCASPAPPVCGSLKAKRAELRPIVEGARQRFRVSAAEVEHQDTWQRAVLGFAAVCASARPGRAVMDEVERFVWSFPEVEVIDAERTWMEEDT